MRLDKQRRIYKINTSLLKKHKWNLDMPLHKAMKEHPELIVTIADSQLMRWIDEINGIKDASAEIRELKDAIGKEKSKPATTKTRRKIRELYNSLYSLQFQKDYITVVMDSVADYDRANQGFTINGIQFRRLFGTSNGVKQRTIVYINAEIYDVIKSKIDNGRNLEMPLVPGKLEAYQALTASGSIVIPQPKGIIVVPDCITHFREDVIQIDDSSGEEPELKHIKDYEIERNNSDGFGLMLPSYSQRVYFALTGEDGIIAGMNTRYAFEKGMVFTFDFLDFAENVAGTYQIKDVWGTVRDIRDAEVILTASQVKLWDSYKSWEDYHENCVRNGYQFSTPKITPDRLENVRELNYQFLNPYTFSNEDLGQLCKPTIETINDVLGGDYRKAIVYLGGSTLTEKSIKKMEPYLQALMIAPEMLNDPYIINTIYRNIRKRIDDAKKGTITINGNYLIVCGDPYALAQSIFNLPVTGLLAAGEVYQKYWIDKGAEEIVCFRAPMTCYNNIRKMKLNKSNAAAYWFRYIDTALLYNAWDSSCDALNGQDFDGDTNLITDNPVLLANTHNAPTIFCIQKRAEKKIVTEEDLIASNKIAFNDDIGAITNRATAMFDLRSLYDPASAEYQALDYRIMCTQHYQQCSIDRIKGVISLPMPKSWYIVNEDMTAADKQITANKKPYFMVYRYPDLNAEYQAYIKAANSNALRRFGMSIPALYALAQPSAEIKEFLDYYEKQMPVTMNDCTVNQICRMIETEFDGRKFAANGEFDYTILKSNVPYSPQMFKAIQAIYNDYQARVSAFAKEAKETAIDKDDADIERQAMRDYFVSQCAENCPDDKVLAEIMLDLCYRSNKNKAFAWDISGSQFVKNLLEKNNGMLAYPAMTDAAGDFEYMGKTYKMERIMIEL